VVEDVTVNPNPITSSQRHKKVTRHLPSRALGVWEKYDDMTELVEITSKAQANFANSIVATGHDPGHR